MLYFYYVPRVCVCFAIITQEWYSSSKGVWKTFYNNCKGGIAFQTWESLRSTSGTYMKIRCIGCVCGHECSAMSDCLRRYGVQPAGLLCPGDSPGENPGVSRRALLQGIFPTETPNPNFPWLPLCRRHLDHSATGEACASALYQFKIL